ncbi:MAG TPA: MFS transporter [Puia sp.]|nr:MFS transporter [Puia sp.]
MNSNKSIFGRLKLIGDNLAVMRIRDVRVYMTGQLVNLLGDWMQQTAQAWVVWEMTHRATALGIVGFLSQIPFFIFGPWVGVFADRFNKRTILLVTQILAALLAVILAVLIQTHWLQLWHIYILAFLLGTVTAFNVTAEQAFIGDIAGTGNIHQAITLNNTVNQLTRLTGPALAGWLIASIGTAAAFWFNGTTVVVSIICILMICSKRATETKTTGGLQQFKEGLTFLKSQQLLRLIILFALIQTFFGMSIVQLLPAFASITLNGDARTLGSLMGAAGAGALVGLVFVLPFVQQIKKPCMAIAGAVVWAGLWYISFSFSRSLPLAMLCQFMASLGAANVITMSLGLAQELTPAPMRARILSTLMMIIFGLQPAASYLVSRSADKIGISNMMIVNGTVMVIVPVLLIALPQLRKLNAKAKMPIAVSRWWH